LKSLMLSTQFSVRIGDAGLESISAIPNLETLEMDETVVTYEGGLKHLKNLKMLKELAFKDTEISDEDMGKLKTALPKVNILWTRPKPEMVEKMTAEMAKRKK
jgi:hypothetical protein